MKLIALLIFVLTVSISHAGGAKKPAPIPLPVPSQAPIPPAEVDLSRPMLTITGCTNCRPDEYERHQAAADKVNQVIQTQCFRNFMESRELIWTNGLTRSQVVDSLIHADVKIQTEMYYTSKRVLGYTLNGVNKEWINRRYMMEWNVCDLASLLAHETSHKKNYGHGKYPSSSRNYTVPYSINFAFDKCCMK